MTLSYLKKARCDGRKKLQVSQIPVIPGLKKFKAQQDCQRSGARVSLLQKRKNETIALLLQSELSMRMLLAV
jgi:hypothetical protein